MLITTFVLIGGFVVYNFVQLTKSVKSTFQSTYSHSDEDIIRYVKDTHGIDVEVVNNLGPRNFHDGGGATVRTTDEHKIIFNIDISYLGNIKGDTYENVSNIYFINEALHSSGDVEKLENIGALDAHIQNPWMSPEAAEYDPVFYFTIGNKIQLSSIDTVEVFNAALPLAKKWREIAANEYNLTIDEIEVLNIDDEDEFQLVTLTIEDVPDDSLDQLESKLVQQNPDVFSQHFIQDIANKLEPLEAKFEGLRFGKHTNELAVICIEMEKLNECTNYSVIIEYKDGMEVTIKNEFRYDDPEVKETLFQTIQMLNDLGLPINQLRINKLYQPSDLEDDQFYTEEELIENENRVHFRVEPAIINDLSTISKPEDIVFER